MIRDPLLRIREVWAPFSTSRAAQALSPARVFRPGAECSSSESRQVPDAGSLGRSPDRLVGPPDPAWLTEAGPALPESSLAPPGIRPWAWIPASGADSGPGHPVPSNPVSIIVSLTHRCPNGGQTAYTVMSPLVFLFFETHSGDSRCVVLDLADYESQTFPTAASWSNPLEVQSAIRIGSS